MLLRFRCHRGSVSVEFAAALPLVAVAMLLVAQVALLVSEQSIVQHAAREGARAAAVTNDDAVARETVVTAGSLDPERATITIEPGERVVGTPVRVTVTYRPTQMPLIARFLPPNITLRASVLMRTERARPP